MRGTPHALGHSAYLSMWQEEGALHVVCLALSFFGSFPFQPSALHCVSVWWVPVFLGVWGLMAGFCQPSVQSPIVEAPECLGHLTSTWRRGCLLLYKVLLLLQSTLNPSTCFLFTHSYTAVSCPGSWNWVIILIHHNILPRHCFWKQNNLITFCQLKDVKSNNFVMTWPVNHCTSILYM